MYSFHKWNWRNGNSLKHGTESPCHRSFE